MPYTVGEGSQGANANVAYAAAIATAAGAALNRDFTNDLRQYLRQNGLSDARAMAWGTRVRQYFANLRRHDGSTNAGTLNIQQYPKMMGPMGWTPTGNGAPALLPGWGKVRPWAIGEARNFLPRAFPKQGSAKFQRQFNKVRSIGGRTSTSRTADQTQTAFFWEEFGRRHAPQSLAVDRTARVAPPQFGHTRNGTRYGNAQHGPSRRCDCHMGQ